MTSPIYLLFKRYRNTKFQEFVAAHDYDLTCNLLKSINGFLPNKVCTLMCPGIEYHKIIYIPRIKKTLTIEGLKKTMKNFISEKKKQYSEEIYDEVHPIYSSQKYRRTIKKTRTTLFFNEENKGQEGSFIHFTS